MARWKIANGWHRVNEHGQLVLCEIGATDFDPAADVTAEAASAGIKPPYRREGSYYVFPRKRDRDAAVARLRTNGYIP